MTARTKPASKPQNAKLSDAMRKSMLEIWQAGLGAFSRAQSEGGAAFAKLAQEGAQLQSRSCELARTDATEVAQSVQQIAGDARKQASDVLRKAETRLEKGISDALHTLGVPVRRDLQALIERIEQLSATVEALTKQKPSLSKRAAGGKKNAVGSAALVRGKTKPAKITPKALAKQAVVPPRL